MTIVNMHTNAVYNNRAVNLFCFHSSHGDGDDDDDVDDDDDNDYSACTRNTIADRVTIN